MQLNMNRDAAVHCPGLSFDQIERAPVDGGREPGHVEKILGARLLVHRRQTEVDRGSVDHDLDLSRPGRTVDGDRAAGLVELPAPERNSHVRELDAGIGVVGVDFVALERGERRLDQTRNQRRRD
jgi:hypothetical protein